jgi:multiple sugar transport system substrate-binding protein
MVVFEHNMRTIVAHLFICGVPFGHNKHSPSASAAAYLKGRRMNRKHMKTAIIAASAAAVLLLSACSGTTTANSSQSTKQIKFVAAEYSTKTAPFWQGVIKSFTAKTGIKVDLQVISWSDIHQQVTTMVQTNQLPDVLNLDSYSQYAAGKLLWPAADVETAALKKAIPQNLAQSGDYKGTQYGIPLLSSTSVLFYNTDLFAQAGIAGPPTTLAELQDDAHKITALGKVGFALSLSPEAPHIDYSTFMFNMGGSYMKNGKWTINSDENVKALDYLNTLAKDGDTEVNPGKTGRVDGSWTLFTAGTAGMTIGQSGLSDRLKSTSVKYATAQFPSSAGVTPTSLQISDYVMAFKKPGNQDAVKKFLDYIYSESNYSTFINNEGLLPVTSAVQAELSSNPAFAPYLKSLKTASSAPVGEANWDAVLGQMKNSLGLAVQGQDPKQILDQIQATATKGQ